MRKLAVPVVTSQMKGEPVSNPEPGQEIPSRDHEELMHNTGNEKSHGPMGDAMLKDIEGRFIREAIGKDLVFSYRLVGYRPQAKTRPMGYRRILLRWISMGVH